MLGSVGENFGENPLSSIRLIPTAKSLFNSSKLNMQRNNIRALDQGNNHRHISNNFSRLLGISYDALQ